MGWAQAGEPSVPGHQREEAQRGCEPSPFGRNVPGLECRSHCIDGDTEADMAEPRLTDLVKLGVWSPQFQRQALLETGHPQTQLTGPASGLQHWEHPETQQGTCGNWIWTSEPGCPGDSCRTSALLPAKPAAGPPSAQPQPGPARAGSCRAIAIQLRHAECPGQACARGLA